MGITRSKVIGLGVCLGPFSPFAVALGGVAGPFLVFQLTCFPASSVFILHTPFRSEPLRCPLGIFNGRFLAFGHVCLHSILSHLAVSQASNRMSRDLTYQQFIVFFLWRRKHKRPCLKNKKPFNAIKHCLLESPPFRR